MSSSDYGMLYPFHIDNGELEGVPLHQIFVLGFEFAKVLGWMENPEEFNSMNIRIENKDRVERTLNKAKVPYTLTFMTEDISESWLLLRITGVGE